MGRLKRKTWQHYLKAQARRIWGWEESRKEAKLRAKIGTDMGGNHLFMCEGCGLNPFRRDQIEVDHIESVENLDHFDGWDAWLNRLFCPAGGLQILCHDCHKAKTKKDSAQRRKARKASK